MTFTINNAHFNYNHWGPTELPEQFLNVPYASFGKGDRLGKAADFTSNYYRNRYNRGTDNTSGNNAEFQYKHDQRESDSFQLVDTVKSTRQKYHNTRLRPSFRGRGRGRGRGAHNGGRGDAHNLPTSAANKGVKGQQQQNKRWDRLNNARKLYGGNRHYQEPEPDREASVHVTAEWKVIEQFDLSQLNQLKANPPKVQDLKWCGRIRRFDDIYDRISTRSEKQLLRFDEQEFHFVTTTEDPVIQDMATSEVGQVFATDAILAHLMSCPRSVYPWDIVVQRIGNALFFDKREDSKLDLVTVNETAYQNNNKLNNEDESSINHPDKLSYEASMINQNYSQQILKDEDVEEYPNPNPFTENPEQAASVGYRYRKWNLGNGVNLVARCEVHGYAIKRGEKELITAYALNEWDSKLGGGIEWRKKIDAQRGAVLATELKNNSCKLAKWTAQSILADADQLKLGYVSRVTKTDPYDHVILGTHTYKPKEFANQIALNVHNMWGIIKMLVDLFMKQPEGKYVLVKDPNKPTVRIYSVPADTFEEDDSEDDEEDQEEE